MRGRPFLTFQSAGIHPAHPIPRKEVSMSDRPIVKSTPLLPPLFQLGQCVITANANSVLHSEDVKRALDRHASGDWGDLCESDWRENEVGLTCGLRLFSTYRD